VGYQGPASPVADLTQVAELAVHHAARECGLDYRGAKLIRLFATAVYHLPAADAVARVAALTSASTLARLETSVKVTRWLSSIGFPAVEPLPVDQPVSTDGCVVTFWRYLPQDGPRPSVADLGSLLRWLHELPLPPVPLPAYRPLTSVGRAIRDSRAVSEEERAWLVAHRDRLLRAYDQLRFLLPGGMIHADAYRGNLLRGPASRAVLADWDAVSIGPREIDLVPTLQAPRFGLPEPECDAFAAAYQCDIRSWDGYRLLRDIRELSTITALLNNGHADPAARQELSVRIQSMQTGDTRQWTTF
jgi:Phosphotransferase enzyme family